MKEDIEKLVKRYQVRLLNVQDFIDEINKRPERTPKDQESLARSRPIEVLWREVIKDLRRITEKK